MLYHLDFPPDPGPVWPEGAGGVPALLPDGTPVQIPALPSISYLILGQPGYGKTVLTVDLTKAFLSSRPETAAVFFQIKPDDFTGPFMNSRSKVITYHAGRFPEETVFHWNMVREIRQSNDREGALAQLGNSLFAHLLEDKRNILWAGGARNTFMAFLRVVVNRYPQECPSNREIVQRLRSLSVPDLMRFLALEPRNLALIRKTFGYDPQHPENFNRKLTQDILMFLNDVLESFGGTFMGDGTDTIHSFLRSEGPLGNRLFILEDLAHDEAGRPFILYFLRKIIDEKMSSSAPVQRPVLMVLDEADKAGGYFHGDIAATLGRGFGLQIITCCQSVESLYAISPEQNREHRTMAALSGYGCVIAFNSGDASTVSTLQTLFGSVIRERVTLSPSRYQPPSVTAQREPAVSDTELTTLGIGECFVKIRNTPPQKVRICHRD